MIYILLVIFLFSLVFLGFFWLNHRIDWRKLKLSDVNISFLKYFMEYYEMKSMKIPPEEIFKALKEAKKLDIEIEIDPLKSFYKTIDKKLTAEIQKFNENLLERELRLKRFWSHYILGCSLTEFANLILESIEEEKPLKIKGNFRTESEKEKERFLVNLIEKIKKQKEDLPALPKQADDEVPEQGFFKRIFKKLFVVEIKPQFDKDYKRFLADLKSELKDGRINLSKEKSHEELKKFVFRDTYDAIYVSLQSRLNVKFRHIEIYLDKNVEIKRILELLNKLHHFEPLMDVDDMEKFVSLRDSESILTSLIHARKQNIPVDLKDLWEYKLRGGNMSTMLEAYVTAHIEGLVLEIPKLTQLVSLRRNVEELIYGLIKLHQEGINLSTEIKAYQKSDAETNSTQTKRENDIDVLGEFQSILGNIAEFIPNLIRAWHLGLNFSYQGLKSYHANGGNIEQLMDILIKAHQADLEINFDDCMQLVHSKGEIEHLFKALKIIKRTGTDIAKDRIMNLHRAGGNMVDFVTAFDLSGKLSLNIKPEDIEADLIEKRNVLPIIFAIIYAKNEGVKIDYNTAIKFDRVPGSNVPERIKWAVNPQVLAIEPIAITTKEGFEIKLHVNTTIRGKFMLYEQANKDEIFFKRIKEALIKEVERYPNYNMLVESLNNVAWRMYMRMNARMNPTDFTGIEEDELNKQNAIEEKQNSISAYEILDVNIPVFEVVGDKLSAIKKEAAQLEKELEITDSERRRSIAKALESEAKAKLIDSAAELQLGMAEAFKKGIIDTKEYYKKRIFDDDLDDSIYTKSIEDDH